MLSPQEQISYVAKFVFDRKLTDISGGNISCRHNGKIYITPTRAGQIHHWNLVPDQILSAPIEDNSLLENPLHSKESISHLLAYRAYPQINGIIHAHPFNILSFCAAEKPIKALLKSTQIIDQSFDFIAEKPMYSQEQGEEIVRKLKGKEKKMEDFGAALLMPQHGIFVVGKTLFWALDILERIDTNAWCQLTQNWLK